MPGPLIIPGSATAQGIALTTYRQRLARTLGYFASGSVTAGASGNPDATRQLISSNIKSDAAPPDLWDGLYLSITGGAQAGTSRKPVNGSFDGPLGALTVDYPFDAALLTGSTFEISVLPAYAYMGAEGLNNIINEGLETLPLVDWVNVTITAGASGLTMQYSLASYAWPIKGIHGVAYPRTNGDTQPRTLMSTCWDFELDGETPILSFRSLPAKADDVIEVGVLRPGHTRIRQSGAWGDSSTGLAAESDQALYDVPSVVNASRPIALQRMALRHARGSKERQSIEVEAGDERWNALFSKFYGGFKRSGAQRAGVR